MASVYDKNREYNHCLLANLICDIIEPVPAAVELHFLHLRGHSLGYSRCGQVKFLSGPFGGPRVYVQKFEYANLKNITSTSKQDWLC